jgi:hypothetical protein
MALKPVVADIAEVPEAARAFYVPKDGKHVLDLEGDLAGQLAAANGRIVDFRENNDKFRKLLGAETIEQALERAGKLSGIDLANLEKLKGVDPDEYQRLKAGAAKVGAGASDDLATKIQEQIAAALAPVTAKNDTLQQKLDAAEKAAQEATLKNVIGAEFMKAGGKPGAVDFIVERAKASFVVEGGVVKAKPNLFSADRPGEALGLGEWLITQTRPGAADFAFEPSAGGGATGGGNGGGTTRPGARRIVNPSPQELGRLQYVAGKGLVDSNGQVVEIAQA